MYLLVISLVRGSRIFANPPDSLAVFPFAELFCALASDINTFAVLLPALPVSLVAATVGPKELSVALLLIINVLSNIFSSVSPGECTFTVHLIISPFAFVFTTV
jgi:hypothetical protein